MTPHSPSPNTPSRRAHTRGIGIVVVAASLLLIAALLLLTGCGDSPASTTETTVLDTTTSSVPPVVIDPNSQKYAQELKDTVTAASAMAARLEQAGVPLDDPQMGTVLTLRARGQAIMARKSLSEGQGTTADQAFREMQALLARASGISQGETAKAITSAQKLAGQMGAPSQDANSGPVLDKIIEALAPLMQVANQPA